MFQWGGAVPCLSEGVPHWGIDFGGGGVEKNCKMGGAPPYAPPPPPTMGNPVQYQKESTYKN